MQFVKCEVSTICLGQAASAAADPRLGHAR